MRVFGKLAVMALVASSYGCAQPEETAAVSEPLVWNAANDPLALNVAMRTDVTGLPAKGLIARPPIANTFWPAYDNSIASRWSPGELSPAEKYELAFHHPGFTRAVVKNYGVGLGSGACQEDSECPTDSKCARFQNEPGRCVPTWFGICNGWAAYSITELPPVRPVVVNGVVFHESDMDALGSMAYANGSNRIMSLRCNVAEAQYQPGVHPECDDTNAGSFHVVLANMIGRWKRGFVADLSMIDTVWNYPVESFDVKNLVGDDLRTISVTDANALLGVETPFSTLASYSEIERAEPAFGDAVPQLNGPVVFKVESGAGNVAFTLRRDGAELCKLTRPDQCLVDVSAGERLTWELTAAPHSKAVTVRMQSGASRSTTYAPNPDVRQLYYVVNEVGVSYGALPQRGRPTASARKELYTYILEVDASGNIVGGEWTGSSVRNHPDFLWVPVSVPNVLLDGLMRFSELRQMMKAAVDAPEEEPRDLVNPFGQWTTDAANGAAVPTLPFGLFQ